MDRVTAAGALLLLLSMFGYVVATVEPYPGRAVTLSGILVGVTLLAVGGAADHGVTGVPEPTAGDDPGTSPDDPGAEEGGTG